MTNEVAFIGLGAMGGPMAANLLAAGHRVRGFDLDSRAMERLVERGGEAAASAAEAAQGAPILVLMVVSAEQAEAALFDHGALDALAPDATVALMATCPPAAVARIGERVEATGRGLCDAPVSGGQAGARAAGLTIMAAGSDAAFRACEPVFAALGSRVLRVGDAPGQGAAAKTVNQLLCGVHIAAAAEALALAERMGLDMAGMLDIVCGSSAASWMLSDRGPRMIAEPGEVTSTIDIFVKDLGIVMAAGGEARAALPIAAAAHQMFLASSGRGEGGLDDSQVIRSWRRLGQAG